MGNRRCHITNEIDYSTMIHIERGNHKYTYHKGLSENFQKLIKAVKNDWDFKILISGDGMTRTGKTTLATQTALYLDYTFNMERVIFRGDKLIEKSLELGKKYGKGIAIVYDEAKEGLDSKKAMNTYSQRITDYFSECGWMNQFLIIVLPEFFDLNKTVALNQSICLINCYTKHNFQRGYFGFYNRRSKRYLYIKGKKWHDYSCQKPSFEGTFNKYFPLDIDTYNKLKLENQRALKQDEAKAEHGYEKRWRLKVQKIVQMMKEDNSYKPKDLINRIGIERSEAYKLFKKCGESEI